MLADATRGLLTYSLTYLFACLLPFLLWTTRAVSQEAAEDKNQLGEGVCDLMLLYTLPGVWNCEFKEERMMGGGGGALGEGGAGGGGIDSG